MNLDDQIRSSASAQRDRYRPADDLLARVDHRRRQRTARRVTATSFAAVVLFGGGALGLTALRDREPRGEIADATVVAIETTVPTTAAASVATVATVTVATTAPATSTPATNAPATNAPVTAAPSDAAVPMPYADPDTPVLPNDFWNVPSYGSEPVLGSGCGTSGQVGDTIPDGIWAGFVAGTADGSVDIDLLCVFPNGSTIETATTVPSAYGYVVVNNSTRARSMPIDERVVLRISAWDSAGRCVDGGRTIHWGDIPPDRQTWVRIHGGFVTWVVADCPPP